MWSVIIWSVIIWKNERYERGWLKLKEIDGKIGEEIFKSLESISPDLGKYIIEFSFGDVYSRKGTSLKQKEIAVVAALTAMGNAAPQLNVHINGALKRGLFCRRNIRNYNTDVKL